jgi:hypothetical protein
MPQPTRRFRAWLGAVDNCNAATSHSSSKAKDREPRECSASNTLIRLISAAALR